MCLLLQPFFDQHSFVRRSLYNWQEVDVLVPGPFNIPIAVSKELPTASVRECAYLYAVLISASMAHDSWRLAYICVLVAEKRPVRELYGLRFEPCQFHQSSLAQVILT